ncbi:MAG: hypothetical protein U0L09_02740 [Christensenellales bacterium]|nr:hypothetical protein [Christensenellales bacterium]
MPDRKMQLPEPPKSFTDAIRSGGRKIRFRRRLRRLSAAVACLIAVVTVAAHSVLLPVGRDAVLDDTPVQILPKTVWAHPEDSCYHRTVDCPACHAGAVQLSRETALQFRKEPCPQCVSS